MSSKSSNDSSDFENIDSSDSHSSKDFNFANADEVREPKIMLFDHTATHLYNENTDKQPLDNKYSEITIEEVNEKKVKTAEEIKKENKRIYNQALRKASKKNEEELFKKLLPQSR